VIQQDLFEKSIKSTRLSPRDYQTEAHDVAFRHWDSGIEGVLLRMATGTGKTPVACLIGDTWMRRSNKAHIFVVTYEKQLVWQFSQEIRDFLGIEPGIEMEAEKVPHDDVPRIVVASRASLLRESPPTPEQLDKLAKYGITSVGAMTKRMAKTYLRHIEQAGDTAAVLEDMTQKMQRPEVSGNIVSRLHKFDWRLDWLVIWDEAHRHAYKLPSVGHITDWFSQNPSHRRLGMTATPKRFDQVSIGHKQFPGIAIDFPLFSTVKRCAVKDGYAVPYIQRYIEVDGVDFRNPELFGTDGDYDDAALERALEEHLAAMVEPLLDLVEDRRTLIFSPGVEMSKNVARYINARVQARCDCGLTRWYPSAMIGDGAVCKCGEMIEKESITKSGDNARQLDGSSPPHERKQVYEGHQNGQFQFLSVCGLCREGYNDPDVSCVAVLRPVSKKASSLAEQMKGRACRPARSLAKKLHTYPDATSRRAAIAASEKPNALIVDLVGITGLADCASTIEIYAEGLPDEVKEKAEKLLAAAGVDDSVDVQEIIEEAKRQDAVDKERIRIEREEAEQAAREEFERRSRAGAEVSYSVNEIGYSTPFETPANLASDGQMKFIDSLGMKLEARPSRKLAGRMIGLLRLRTDPARVAALCGIQEDAWQASGPSPGQCKLMAYLGIATSKASSRFLASLVIGARKEPAVFEADCLKRINESRNRDELHAVGLDLSLVYNILPRERWDHLAQQGKRKKALMGAAQSMVSTPTQHEDVYVVSDEPIPD
jgi:superfamily II DNA or RNA helicase